jgi:hypothetical protein
LHESNSSATTAISVSDSEAKTVNLKTNHRAGRGGEPLDFSPLFQIDKGFSANPIDSASSTSAEIAAAVSQRDTFDLQNRDSTELVGSSDVRTSANLPAAALRRTLRPAFEELGNGIQVRRGDP